MTNASPSRRLAILAALMLLGGCGSVVPPAPTASAPTASAPGPSLTGRGTPEPSPPDTWQPVVLDGERPPLHLNDVIATSGGYVAVGQDLASHHAAALSSSDGLTWTSETIPSADRSPGRIVRWGDRLLAFGAGEAQCAHPSALDTWVRDGETWAEAPFVDLLCDASMVDAAIVNGVPLLVGTGPGDNPVAWSSADGLHWEDHSGIYRNLLPRGVASDGSTAWVFGKGAGRIWMSRTTDGLSWSPPDPFPDLPGSIDILGAVMVGDTPTMIAVKGREVGAIDWGTGGGWVMSPADGLPADQLGTVRAFDGGLVAFGSDQATALAWVSRDGLSWRAIDLPAALLKPDASVVALAVRGDRAILIGAGETADGLVVSSIWTGAAALVAP